jgi:hypothetical protein
MGNPRLPKAPKPFKESIFVQIDEDVLKRARMYAGRNNTSLVEMIRVAIQYYLDEYDVPHPKKDDK